MKKLKAQFFLLIFYYWSWGHKILPGTLVSIPIWILPVPPSDYCSYATFVKYIGNNGPIFVLMQDTIGAWNSQNSINHDEVWKHSILKISEFYEIHFRKTALFLSNSSQWYSYRKWSSWGSDAAESGQKFSREMDIHDLAENGLAMDVYVVNGCLHNNRDINMAMHDVLQKWRVSQSNGKVAYANLCAALEKVGMGDLIRFLN